MNASSQPEQHLHRRFGLLQATALNMSNMIGLGPFITIPTLMSALGGPQAMLGWLVALAGWLFVFGTADWKLILFGLGTLLTGLLLYLGWSWRKRHWPFVRNDFPTLQTPDSGGSK